MRVHLCPLLQFGILDKLNNLQYLLVVRYKARIIILIRSQCFMQMMMECGSRLKMPVVCRLLIRYKRLNTHIMVSNMVYLLEVIIKNFLYQLFIQYISMPTTNLLLNHIIMLHIIHMAIRLSLIQLMVQFIYY